MYKVHKIDIKRDQKRANKQMTGAKMTSSMGEQMFTMI